MFILKIIDLQGVLLCLFFFEMLSKVIILHIEKKFGKEIRYPSDCDALSEDVFLHTKQKISVSTLKRLLGFVNGVQDPRLYTLDILAKYLEYTNWDVYLEEIKSSNNSEFFNVERLDVESLAVETKIKIAYEPNRIIELKYIGNFNFKIESSENSKLQVGDIVKITNFVKNFPLLISEVKRNDQNLGQYRAGKSGGLSEIKIIE